MAELDETDILILQLLAEDGRRSYSEIGEVVNLTPPAVSDRVSKLEAAGIIEGFTIEVDQSVLQGGLPVLVRIEPAPGRLDAIREPLAAADAVEHVFTTADGALVAFARVTDEAVHGWLDETVSLERVTDYEVELVADVSWSPTVEATGFAIDCAECDNDVDTDGVATRVGGELKHFCCETCETQFRDRYDQFEEAA